MRPTLIAALLCLSAQFLPLASLPAGVVINEIFYNAPGDLDDLQWIELHNAGDQPVDLGGWLLDGGAAFVFPPQTRIDGRGYLVVALQPEEFQKAYGAPSIGPLKRRLKRSGERLELTSAQRNSIDTARFKDRAPWPASADGASASLERISPSSAGDDAENWAASPLALEPPKPGGTPGRQNASFSPVLPPSIASVTMSPADPTPSQPLAVEAEVKENGALREVTLIWRAVVRGVEGAERETSMARDAASGRFRALIPPQEAGTLVRYRIRAVNEAGARRIYPAEHDPRPALSAYVHEPWDLGMIPLALIVHVRAEGTPDPGAAEDNRSRRGSFGGRRGRGPGFFFGPGGRFGERAESGQRPERGSSAFIYVDAKTDRPAVFDFLTINERAGGRGFRVHFHKDHTLDGRAALNIVHEGSERFLLAEAFAYDVYRRAGSPAPLAEFVRLWVDGREVGHHLMIERINRSFLRRNKLDDGGNLYKLLWFGGDLIGQHEKRTNTRSGHEDLVAVVERLGSTSGDEQWKVIQESFNVEQVATYFAVNAVLSHWDGFFNNYFAYHDSGGTGKWEVYPWDQDKTSGYYDGVGDGEVFFDMPLTFGMNGAAPPGARRDSGEGGPAERGRSRSPFGFGGPFGGGASWWRPPGHFSGPLLANHHFRKVFLRRTREVLETVFTPEACAPFLEGMTERLRGESERAARARGEDPVAAVRLLERDTESLREHLLKRRQFLLADEELSAAKGGG